MSLDTPEIENYHFLVDKWLDKNEDDGQIVREIIATDERGNPIIEIEG